MELVALAMKLNLSSVKVFNNVEGKEKEFVEFVEMALESSMFYYNLAMLSLTKRRKKTRYNVETLLSLNFLRHKCDLLYLFPYETHQALILFLVVLLRDFRLLMYSINSLYPAFFNITFYSTFE